MINHIQMSLISVSENIQTPPSIQTVPRNLAYIKNNNVVIPVKSLESYTIAKPPTLEEMCEKLKQEGNELKEEKVELKMWTGHHKVVGGKAVPDTKNISMENMCALMGEMISSVNVNLYLRSTDGSKKLCLFKYEKNKAAEASAASPFRPKKSQRSRSKSAKKRRNLKKNSKSKSKKRSPKPRRR